MKHREEYKKRLHTFQSRILTIQLIVIVLGGAVFTLGVISRPILRIINSENIPTVRWMVNVMVSASLVQMVAAAYDIFAGCFRRIYPIYLGIAGTSLTVMLELTAICSSLFLYTSSLTMVNEEVVHAWYWVECLKFTSCHDRMLGYIHWYILPQIILAIITVILQCTTILFLSKLVRTIAQRFKVIQEVHEKYKDEWEEKKFNEAFGNFSPIAFTDVQTKAADSTDDILKTPKRVQFSDEMDGNEGSGSSSARKRAAAAGVSQRKMESIEMDSFGIHTTTSEAQVHVGVEGSTPGSIVMEDHGYIPGSRVSLDMDKF